MPRGQDSRHDSSRQVSREAMAAKAASMAPNVDLPASGVGTSAADTQMHYFGNIRTPQPRAPQVTPEMKQEWEAKKAAAEAKGQSFNVNPDGTLGTTSQTAPDPRPSSGWFAETFPGVDPEKAAAAYEMRVATSRRIEDELIGDSEVPDNNPQAAGLVDVGMPMPAAGEAQVKGDTKVSFDPSIMADQRKTTVKKAEKEFQKKRSAEGRLAAAEASGEVSKRTAKAARSSWGDRPVKQYKEQQSTEERKAALEEKKK